MTRNRADLGFENLNDPFNPDDWAVGAPAPARPSEGIARKAAEATGFHSREARVTPEPPEKAGAGGATKPRRRRTGRNAQLNLKARPDTIESFCAIADAQGWGLGETLEHAVRLLEQDYGKPRVDEE